MEKFKTLKKLKTLKEKYYHVHRANIVKTNYFKVTYILTYTDKNSNGFLLRIRKKNPKSKRSTEDVE